MSRELPTSVNLDFVQVHVAAIHIIRTKLEKNVTDRIPTGASGFRTHHRVDRTLSFTSVVRC
jgi:hypothetical protein